MTNPLSPARIEQLRRNARRLSRTQSISHSDALNRIAAQHGFKNWSLLSKHNATALKPSTPPPELSLSTPASQGPPADARQRYYLHGDQFESDPRLYYCAVCDVFCDPEHFTSHGPHTGERYLYSLDRWGKRDARASMERRRPDDAVNVLRDFALAARAEYQALRPAFSEWLLLQRKRTRAGERRDNIGLMSLGLVSNRGLPKTPASLPLLREHFQRHGAQHFELEALELAWSEFLAARSARSEALSASGLLRPLDARKHRFGHLVHKLVELDPKPKRLWSHDTLRGMGTAAPPDDSPHLWVVEGYDAKTNLVNMRHATTGDELILEGADITDVTSIEGAGQNAAKLTLHVRQQVVLMEGMMRVSGV